VQKVVDITEVSAMVAAAGVLAGVVYYVLDMRNQARVRKTDLIVRITPWFNLGPKEFAETANTMMALTYKDYDDFVRKYGSLYSGKPEATVVRMLMNWAEGVGMLLKRNLIDVDIVFDAYGTIASVLWEKVKPLVEGYRKENSDPQAWSFVEYLAKELEKREQQQ
jgi:hypothetical protein